MARPEARLVRRQELVDQIADHTHTSEDVESFPVGSVFITAVNTNPDTLLGYGVWQLIGSGEITLT